MDELIKQLVGGLGISPDHAQQAVASVLAMLKKEGGDDLFGKIAGAIPGAAAAADNGASPTTLGGGGLVGSLLSTLGGNAGKGAALLTSLQALGIKPEQLSTFGNLMMQFLQQHAGSEVVEQLLAKVPLLANLKA
jgi:hypothetical protein